MRTWVRTLWLALAGLGLLPCAASADEKYVISAEVWSVYQEYLAKIDNGDKPGAYAITKDGYGAFYVWCEEIRCMAGTTYSQDAINYCEDEYDTECVTFAVRDEIRVSYEVAAGESSLAPEASDPPPADRLVVSAAVQAEIDAYLANAQSTTHVWALAIARDGSGVARANCPANYGYRGGGPCAPIKGAPQELASREAIMRCGGAATCMLLYEGVAKKVPVDIVLQ